MRSVGTIPILVDMTVTTNVLPPLPDPAQRTIPEIGSIRGPASVIRSALIVYVFRGPKVGDDRQRGIIGGASCLQSLIVLVTYAPGHYRIFTAGNRAEVSHFVVDGWGKAVVVSPVPFFATSASVGNSIPGHNEERNNREPGTRPESCRRRRGSFLDMSV